MISVCFKLLKITQLKLGWYYHHNLGDCDSDILTLSVCDCGCVCVSLFKEREEIGIAYLIWPREKYKFDSSQFLFFIFSVIITPPRNCGGVIFLLQLLFVCLSETQRCLRSPNASCLLFFLPWGPCSSKDKHWYMYFTMINDSYILPYYIPANLRLEALDSSPHEGYGSPQVYGEGTWKTLCLSGNEQYQGISLEGLANVICTQLGYDAEWVALSVCLPLSLPVSLSLTLNLCLSLSLSLSVSQW